MEADYKRQTQILVKNVQHKKRQKIQVTAKESTVRYKQNFLHNHGGADLEQMPSFAISIPGDIKNLTDLISLMLLFPSGRGWGTCQPLDLPFNINSV